MFPSATLEMADGLTPLVLKTRGRRTADVCVDLARLNLSR